MQRENSAQKILRSAQEQGRLAKGYGLVTFDSVLIHSRMALVFASHVLGASMQIGPESIPLTSGSGLWLNWLTCGPRSGTGLD
jgi:hypothetical protein